jgi:hypothetical protein
MSRGTTIAGRRRWMAAIAAGAGALTFSSSAQAFLCTRTPNEGPSVAWSTRQLIVRPSARGAEVDEAAIAVALDRATAAWSGVPCSDLELLRGEPTTERLVGFDWHKGSDDPGNENLLVFRNDDEALPPDAWVHSLGAIAITTVTFDTTTGRIVDADVEMNDTSFLFTACEPEDASCAVDFDVQNTLTHELGHVLGLDHPPPTDPGAVEATMFASAARGDTSKRTLARDDEEGLCTIYPAGSAEPGECYGVGRPPPSTVRFEETSCGAVGAGAPLTVICALVGALLWPRRRRPRADMQVGNATSEGPIA